MPNVELPGGFTAELREKPTVGGRDLLQEEGAELFAMIADRWPNAKEMEDIPLQELGRDGMRAFHHFNRVVIVALLKSWTRPEPLPTLDAFGDLDTDTYDALSVAVAPLALPALMGSRFDRGDAGDPERPTVPSSDSNGGGQDRTTPTTDPPTGSSESSTNTSTANA